MLHLSTGIALRNKIHAATEWGSRSERNEMEWNGDANEELRNRNGINLRDCGRCCRGRYPGPSATAADPGGREGANRQRPDRHKGLIPQRTDQHRWSVPVRRKREVVLLRHVAATGTRDLPRPSFA